MRQVTSAGENQARGQIRRAVSSGVGVTVSVGVWLGVGVSVGVWVGVSVEV